MSGDARQSVSVRRTPDRSIRAEICLNPRRAPVRQTRAGLSVNRPETATGCSDDPGSTTSASPRNSIPAPPD